MEPPDDYDFHYDRYYNLRMVQYTEEDLPDGPDNYIINFTPHLLNQSYCNDSSLISKLPDTIKDYLQRMNYSCASVSTLNLQGTGTSGFNSSYYSLEVDYCSDDFLAYLGKSYKCATLEEQENVIKNSRLEVFLISEYFNSSLFYQEPLQKLVKEYSFAYIPGTSTQQNIYLHKNYLTTKDSWLMSSIQNQQYEYYDYQFDLLSFGAYIPGSSNVLTVFFFRSFEESYIERQTINLLDILSETGGFQGIVAIFIGMLISSYQQNQFFNAILGSMFKYQQSMIKTYQKKPQILYESVFKGSRRHLFDILYESIMNRFPAKIEFMKKKKPIICKLCKKKKTVRDINLEIEFQKKQRLEERAKAKLSTLFSIEKIIGSMRKLKLVSLLIFTKSQLKLFPFLVQNLISINDIKQLKYEDYQINQEMRKSKTFLQVKKKKDRNQSFIQREIGESLEEVIKECTNDEVNQKLLQNLVNFEEKDGSELKILISSIQEKEGIQDDSPRKNFLRSITNPSFSRQNSIKKKAKEKKKKEYVQCEKEFMLQSKSDIDEELKDTHINHTLSNFLKPKKKDL